MCVKSQTECQDPEIIQDGFVIERSLEGVRDLALSLTSEDTGAVVKKRGDYAVRQGVCGVPITTESDLTKSIPVCHSKIRTFEFCKDLVVRSKSHKKWKSQTNNVAYTKEENEKYKAALEEVKEAVYQNLAINIETKCDKFCLCWAVAKNSLLDQCSPCLFIFNGKIVEILIIMTKESKCTSILVKIIAVFVIIYHLVMSF